MLAPLLAALALPKDGKAEAPQPGGGGDDAGTLTLVDDTVSVTAGEVVTVTPLDNDSASDGSSLFIVSTTAPTKGTLVQSNNTLTYRAAVGDEGSHTITYKVESSTGLSGSARVTFEVKASALAADAYDYTHKAEPAPGAATVLPATNADIMLWEVPEAGGTYSGDVGSVAKSLLIVMPDKPCTGSVVATGLKVRSVFVIGGEFQRAGTRDSRTPAGQTLKGGDLLQIGFATGLTHNPIIWVSNLAFNAHATTPNEWGDHIAVGGGSRHAKLYIQKCKWSHGHHGWADTGGLLADANASLSAAISAKLGPVGNVFLSQLDIKTGCRGLWLKPTSAVQTATVAGTVSANPDVGLAVKASRVVFRPTEASTSVASTGYAGRITYMWLTGSTTSGEPETKTLAQWQQLGRYWSLDASGVYLQPTTANTAIGQYVAPSAPPTGTGLTIDTTAKKVETYSYTPTGVTGAVAVFRGEDWGWGVEPASPVVADSEVGIAARVTTKARLREIVEGVAKPERPPADRTITVGTYAQLKAVLETTTAGAFPPGVTTTPAGAQGPIKPGDHIVLSAGTYDGEVITIPAALSGTAAKPIVIRTHRSVADLRASDDNWDVLLDCPILVRANYIEIHGMKIVDGKMCPQQTNPAEPGEWATIYFRGKGCRVCRNWFVVQNLKDSRGSIRHQFCVFGETSEEGVAEFNTLEFTGTAGTAGNERPTKKYSYALWGITVTGGTINQATAGLTSEQRLNRNPRGRGSRLRRNHVNKFPGDDFWGSPPPTYGWFISSTMDVGGAYERGVNNKWYGRVDHNLFTNCGANCDLSFRQTGDESDGKPGMVADHNTIIGGDSYLRLRYARNMWVIANYIDGTGGYPMFGDDHVYIGNVVIGGGEFGVSSGTMTPEYTYENNATWNPTTQTEYQWMRCDNIKFYYNQGYITLNRWNQRQADPTLSAINIVIVGHKAPNGTAVTGTAFPSTDAAKTIRQGRVIEGKPVGVTISATGTAPTPPISIGTTARRLTTTEVGRKAPWVAPEDDND